MQRNSPTHAPATAGDSLETAQPLGTPSDSKDTVLPWLQDATNVGVLLGRYQTACAFATMSRVAMLRAYAQIKESDAYRQVYLTAEDGNQVRAKTLEHFCLLAFGRPYRAMEEDLQNLRDLGEALYLSAETLCLRRADMRALRALPAPERAKIESAIDGKSDTRQIRALISDLAEDLAAARKQADVSAAKVSELQDVVGSQAKDLADAKKQIKALQSYVPSDDAAEQSRADELTIADVQESLKVIMQASARIGMILDDARKQNITLSRACCERLNGLVEMELRRWYAYSDMAREAVEVRKQR